MIELKNVSKSYIKDKEFIKDMNLKINDGEIFGFLGPNGAGKTTVIKMITGILNPDEGDILVDNISIKNDPIKAKNHFGLVSDDPDAFLKLKGIEYLNFLGDIYDIPVKLRKEKIESLAKRFDMIDSLNEKIESYSHGMRQKIFIMGAVLHSPNNWILDEPLTGLDPKSSHDLKFLMQVHSRSGNTVFFSTHVLEVAEKVCDRIGIINDGKLIFVGTIQEMKDKFKEDKSLEELFIEMTEKN